MINFNLCEYINGKQVLSGRDKGEKLRETLKLDMIDINNEQVKIIIPKEVYAFNSSYFLGLFGKSVRLLGKQKFESKYLFDSNDIVRMNIIDGINDALNDVDVFGG